MPSLHSQYAYNVSAGPEYASADLLPPDAPSDVRARAIAFYLPQFHRIAENDEWWGSGFTEWTNVTKALPRYIGQKQPRLPADLGFYDLRNPEVLVAQADLARRAGLAGFCIHDYWFGGRKVLETPLQNLLANESIDLPFCLSWANENWSRRWDGSEQDILLMQKYDSQDPNGYVRSILPALADERYITVNGRPLILIYRPSQIPEARRTFDSWRHFLASEGMANPYLMMAQSHGDSDPSIYGLDGAAGFPPHNTRTINHRYLVRRLDLGFHGSSFSYNELAAKASRNWDVDNNLFPGICPSWDNEARKPGRGSSFFGASPRAYGAWLDKAVASVAGRPEEERLIFINAWNEWAEGAVLEPDRHYGHRLLVTTRQVLESAHKAAVNEQPNVTSIYEAPRINPLLRALSARIEAAIRRSRSQRVGLIPARLKTWLEQIR